jgi:PAP2 superfamily
VIDLELSMDQAAATAAVLAAGTLLLRQSGRPRLRSVSVFSQETALVLGLFALWQYAGSFAVLGPAGALGRSRWIWHAERVLHLPSETSLQRVFLPHPLLIQFFNLYYDSLHFPVLITCMVWLFVRHRDSYQRLRTTLVVFTGSCLLVQLIPVAPPRMLTGTGLVDTAILYHQSVYATSVGFDPDELSAMPSVHVGWAVLVAFAVITTARSRWRWLALAYPVMTTLTVVITANHFWADGIVATALLAAVILLQAGGRRVLARLRHADLGLFPEHPAWDDLSNNDPVGIQGSNGNSGHPEGRRAPAERDRAT